jgi:dTDP-6-deoxy-L-talose 4-dehydrogenase (NAD+)
MSDPDLDGEAVKPIHLVGSGGFIGNAVQRQAGQVLLRCWSHTSNNQVNFFDLLDPNSWQTLLINEPETVILLSWPGLPNYQQSFHVTRNLPATLQLVEQLIAAGLKRIVVAGTCYEYGLQNGALQEYHSTDPLNFYAIAKDSLRRSVANICEQHKVCWSWLRIFYPFGDGQNPKSLLPSLEHAIQSRNTSFPMSSGRQLRDFIHVDKVADLLLLLATHPLANGIYNGGTGDAYSLREFVEFKIRELSADIKLECGVYPDRQDEPLAFWADVSRIHSLQKTHFFS